MTEFSIIVPTYNRVAELREFLDFADKINYPKQDFELIVVDDGSQDSTLEFLQEAKKKFTSLRLHYDTQVNQGPAKARNKGASFAKGKYLLFVDSDCLLPAEWLNEIKKELDKQEVLFFGGPDRESVNFSNMQKAISYAMTGFWTTGGIRGSRKKNFQPRSFNMGIELEAFKSVAGFKDLRFGEDIDLSIRLSKKGYQSRLFPNAWVYHKRRTNLKQFFRQVLNSGSARVNLAAMHPKSTKIVHLLPAGFILGVLGLIVGSFFYPQLLIPILGYTLLLYIGAMLKYKKFFLPFLCVITGYTQLVGYGYGYLLASIRKAITGKSRYDIKVEKFYD